MHRIFYSLYYPIIPIHCDLVTKANSLKQFRGGFHTLPILSLGVVTVTRCVSSCTSPPKLAGPMLCFYKQLI